jgi:hypothetical protein
MHRTAGPPYPHAERRPGIHVFAATSIYADANLRRHDDEAAWRVIAVGIIPRDATDLTNL